MLLLDAPIAIYVLEVATKFAMCEVIWGISCVLSGVAKSWEMNLKTFIARIIGRKWIWHLGPRVTIANTLVEVVQYRTAIHIIYMCASNKFWPLQRQTTKPPDLNFPPYFPPMVVATYVAYVHTMLLTLYRLLFSAIGYSYGFTVMWTSVSDWLPGEGNTSWLVPFFEIKIMYVAPALPSLITFCIVITKSCFLYPSKHMH